MWSITRCPQAPYVQVEIISVSDGRCFYQISNQPPNLFQNPHAAQKNPGPSINILTEYPWEDAAPFESTADPGVVYIIYPRPPVQPTNKATLLGYLSQFRQQRLSLRSATWLR